MAGRVAAIPVANPLAVTVFDRQTPEQHGKTDLHEVFPGAAHGNLTQKLAGAISVDLLDHVDALIDMHCGGLGGRLQSRADLDASANKDVYEKSLKLCRAFNTAFIHANNLAGTAARYCNGRGVPTANPEIGGVYLGPQAESAYFAETVTGLRSVMAALDMIIALEPAKPEKKQLLFGVKSHFEVNPTVGGYLQSNFASPGDLGRRIEKGELLGEIVDIHKPQAGGRNARIGFRLSVFLALFRRGRCRHQSVRACRRSDVKMVVKSDKGDPARRERRRCRDPRHSAEPGGAGCRRGGAQMTVGRGRPAAHPVAPGSPVRSQGRHNAKYSARSAGHPLRLSDRRGDRRHQAWRARPFPQHAEHAVAGACRRLTVRPARCDRTLRGFARSSSAA